MSIRFSTLFFICIALVIPLLVLSTSNQDLQEEMTENIKNQLDQFADSNHRSQQSLRSPIHDADYNNDDHFILKKAADFEQILKPCNRMPASGRGQEYAECVRSRMLLMGRRKR